MKNPLHGAWHVTGTKTHQPEPTEGLLSGHVNINPHNTLAKPLLMASFCKEEEDAQSNFWPWSTKLVTETEYKAGPFWSQNYASSTIIHCKLFYFLENFSLPLDFSLYIDPQSCNRKRLQRPWVDTKAPPQHLWRPAADQVRVWLTTDCVCVCVCVCVCAQSLSCMQLFLVLWTAACQAPLSMEFSRQEYWVGWHALLQGIFPTLGSNMHLLRLLHQQVGSLPLAPLGKPGKPL